jgi:hypothetical protein
MVKRYIKKWHGNKGSMDGKESVKGMNVYQHPLTTAAEVSATTSIQTHLFLCISTHFFFLIFFNEPNPEIHLDLDPILSKFEIL